MNTQENERATQEQCGIGEGEVKVKLNMHGKKKTDAKDKEGKT